MNKRFFRANRYRSSILSGTRPLVASGLVIFVGILFTVRMVAPGAITTVASPAWKGSSRLSAAAGTVFSFSTRAELMRERDDFSAKNADLTAQNAALAARVADLTALLGTRTEAPQGILASVLARPPVAPYDVLVIDQGSADGVTEGALAFGQGGTPIGTVASVSTHSARVTLYSARGIQTAAWAGATRVPITLTGDSAGAFEASIAKDAGVVSGDSVYVASSGAFPIGVITNIESDPSSPDVALDIRPYTNPFSLTWVTIAPAR